MGDEHRVMGDEWSVECEVRSEKCEDSKAAQTANFGSLSGRFREVFRLSLPIPPHFVARRQAIVYDRR